VVDESITVSRALRSRLTCRPTSPSGRLTRVTDTCVRHSLRKAPLSSSRLTRSSPFRAGNAASPSVTLSTVTGRPDAAHECIKPPAASTSSSGCGDTTTSGPFTGAHSGQSDSDVNLLSGVPAAGSNGADIRASCGIELRPHECVWVSMRCKSHARPTCRVSVYSLSSCRKRSPMPVARMTPRMTSVEMSAAEPKASLDRRR